MPVEETMEKELAAQASLVVRGSWARIKKLMQRAKEGADLHIGFLGGSITQGSLAAAPENCYAALVYRWWEETFPQSRFSYINAGIGGTSSLFGAARAWTDLMCYRPDFVIVDFSVNDDAVPFFQETFEGVIRQLYGSGQTAVMVLNNVFYEDGRNAQELHNEVAAHYQIPAVSMREGLYSMIRDGSFPAREVTPDGLHPNDKGHALLAYMISWHLEKIYEDLGTTEEEPEYPPALTRNRFEHAKRYQIFNSHPELRGFLTDPREKTALLDLYKNGWMAERVGDRFTLNLECSYIAVQYLRSVRKPRPVAEAVVEAVVDGADASAVAEAIVDKADTSAVAETIVDKADTSAVAEAIVDGAGTSAVTLDGNFDEDWGDCLALTEVLDQERRGRHRLTVTLKETHPSEAGPFYLVSVITD